MSCLAPFGDSFVVYMNEVFVKNKYFNRRAPKLHRNGRATQNGQQSALNTFDELFMH